MDNQDGDAEYRRLFDEKYGSHGGSAQLLALYKQGLSNPKIAEEMNLSEELVRTSLKRIVGSAHRPWPFRIFPLG